MVIEKRCPRCSEIKPIEEFGRDKTKCSGRTSHCKKCKYEHEKKYKQTDKYKIGKKQRRNNPEIREKEREKRQILRKINHQKIRAREIARKKVIQGIIKKQPCEVCSEEKVEMHHIDYSKPLEVVFLCFKHHTELHRKISKGET